jgi:hypothetical protein
VSRGSWEILTHCPSCKEEWPVDPAAPRRVKRAISVKAAVFCVLTCLPLAGAIWGIVNGMWTSTDAMCVLGLGLCAAGIIMGLLSAFWGYLALRTKRTALGVAAMLVGVVIGVAAQSMVIWWLLGARDDSRCEREMAAFSRSVREYVGQTGCYPPTEAPGGSEAKDGPTAQAAGPVPLNTLEKMKLPAPLACPQASEEYWYLPSSPLGRWWKMSNCPLLAWPPQPLPFAGGDAGTLLVAEKEQSHRRFRMCMTSDMVVRELPPRQFEALLALPRNIEFHDAIGAKTPDKLQEEPNRRINFGVVSLGPRQTLHAAIAAIAIFGVICIGYIIRATIKARKE